MTSASVPAQERTNNWFSLRSFKGEKLIIGAFITAIIAYMIEHTLIGNGQTIARISTFILIAVIILAAIRVAHHAEVLAEKVGDPYGTMILTTAAVMVEVVILAIMMNHNPSPTLARDTIYAALFFDLNMIIGLAALFGGFKHGEQVFNDDSGRSYSVMIIVAIGISMVIPKFVPVEHWQSYSVFTIVLMVSLYGLFLRMQTKEHSYFFSYNYEKTKKKQELAEQHIKPEYEHPLFSAVMLIAGLIVTGILAETMSQTMNIGLEGTGVPPIFGGIVVALISASPEILTAMRAALENKYQVTVNIGYGASLATVLLTVPVIELVALCTGHDIDMSLTPIQMAMVGITLAVAALNVSDGETNAIEGSVHFVLFATFIFLSCIGL